MPKHVNLMVDVLNYFFKFVILYVHWNLLSVSLLNYTSLNFIRKFIDRIWNLNIIILCSDSRYDVLRIMLRKIQKIFLTNLIFCLFFVLIFDSKKFIKINSVSFNFKFNDFILTLFCKLMMEALPCLREFWPRSYCWKNNFTLSSALFTVCPYFLISILSCSSCSIFFGSLFTFILSIKSSLIDESPNVLHLDRELL